MLASVVAPESTYPPVPGTPGVRRRGIAYPNAAHARNEFTNHQTTRWTVGTTTTERRDCRQLNELQTAQNEPQTL